MNESNDSLKSEMDQIQKTLNLKQAESSRMASLEEQCKRLRLKVQDLEKAERMERKEAQQAQSSKKQKWN